MCEALTDKLSLAGLVASVSALMPCRDMLEDAYLTIDFTLGDGLEEARAAGVFDLAVDRLMGELIDCLTLAKFVWRTANAAQDDAQCMCKMAKDVLSGLCAFKADSVSLRGKRIRAPQLALVITLARGVTRYAHWSSPPNMERLKIALHRVEVDWNFESDDLLAPRPAYNQDKPPLWVLMTGHYAAYDYEEEVWFRVRAAYIAQKLGISNYIELHEHMRRYLYSWMKQKMSLEAVALHLSSREAG